MSPERWERVSEILDLLFEQPPERWDALLDDVCEDEAVRAEVEGILEAEDKASDFLEAGAAPHLSALLPDNAATTEAEDRIDPLDSGEQLGAYQIVEKLGQGGMSVVYRAERTDGQFEQTVAVKLLRGVLDPEVIQRFQAERHILAALDHPNIARILDGGTTSEGRPYLVMEYVDGRPITEYCDAHQLSIEERIDLFCTVAETVQHAHQSLIIHRDLKPSNVLVREDGTVKLLDFGIAKVLDAGSHDSLGAPSTRTGRQLMTPEYAAPEQVRGDAIATATDVYALGILLYELLAGRRPYQFNQPSPYEVVRTVCETEPARPSTVATTSQDDAPNPPEIAAARNTDVDHLTHQLRGDLDAIVLKALRKDPEARYDTAAALVDDLTAYREERPVQAHADSWSYRFRKLLRRRRTAVASGALITVLLVAYAITITVQANRIRAERNEAEAVTAFLVDLFEGSDPLGPPTAAAPDSVTLRSLLDRGANRVRTELEHQPSVRARLMSVIGQVYTNTGNYGRADSLLRSALDLQRSLGEGASLNQAQTKQTLAYSLFRQGRFEESKQLYRDALDLLRRRHGSAPLRQTRALNGLALVLGEQGQPEKAEPLYRRAIELHRAHGDSVPGTYVHNLAISLERQNQFEKALEMHEKALSLFRARHGDAHPSVASAMARMAFTYQRAGQLATADSLHRKALAMRRELLPPDHPHIASSLVRYSWLLAQRGQPQQAEPMAREGLSILRSILPPDHWQITAARGVLGLCIMAKGQFEKAEPLLRTQFRRSRTQFGTQDWRTRGTARALATLYRQWNKPDSAARYARWLSKTAPKEAAEQLPIP